MCNVIGEVFQFVDIYVHSIVSLLNDFYPDKCDDSPDTKMFHKVPMSNGTIINHPRYLDGITGRILWVVTGIGDIIISMIIQVYNSSLQSVTGYGARRGLCSWKPTFLHS